MQAFAVLSSGNGDLCAMALRAWGSVLRAMSIPSRKWEKPVSCIFGIAEIIDAQAIR